MAGKERRREGFGSAQNMAGESEQATGKSGGRVGKRKRASEAWRRGREVVS